MKSLKVHNISVSEKHVKFFFDHHGPSLNFGLRFFFLNYVTSGVSYFKYTSLENLKSIWLRTKHMAKWTKSVLGICKYVTKQKLCHHGRGWVLFFPLYFHCAVKWVHENGSAKELQADKTSVILSQKQRKRRLRHSRRLFFCHRNQGSNVCIW